MAGGKETPRQKMIGMMYLVLTALLALNVSKEIINAFVTLNNKIEAQNVTFEQSSSTVQTRIKNSITQAKSEAGWEEIELGDIKARAEKEENGKILNLFTLLESADSVENQTKTAIADLLTYADGILQEGSPGEWVVEDEMGYMKIADLNNEESPYGGKDNYDIPTYHMVEQGKGDEMLAGIYEFRSTLINQVLKVKVKGNDLADFEVPEITQATPGDTAFLQPLIEAIDALPDSLNDAGRTGAILEIYKILTFPEKVMNHGEEVPWVAGQFDHAPIAAAAAIFTSIKGQMLQASNVVMKFLEAQNDVPPFKFDTIDPLAYAPTSYINSGDSLRLTVRVAAYDSKADPKVRIWVDDSSRDMESENFFEIERNEFVLGRDVGGGVGKHFVDAAVEVEQDGKKTFQFIQNPFTYEIGTPSAAIGNVDLNVMYASYDNQIVASGSGYPVIKASCSGCASFQPSKLKDGSDGYIARVPNSPGSTVTVSVQGIDDEGKSTQIGTKEFRIMQLPPPSVFIAGGSETASALPRSTIAGGFLGCKLIGAPIDKKFVVTGGTVTLTVQGIAKDFPFQGNKMPAAAAGIIRQMAPGSVVMISPMVSSGGGAPQKTKSVSYKVL